MSPNIGLSQFTMRQSTQGQRYLQGLTGLMNTLYEAFLQNLSFPTRKVPRLQPNEVSDTGYWTALYVDILV